jgi:cobalt/nickel transport system permease protein
MKRILIVGGIVAVVLAAVSFYASSQPDGLEKVAGDYGILDNERDSATATSPLADYSLSGVSNERLSGAVAGLVGVAVTAAVGFGLFYTLRRRH